VRVACCQQPLSFAGSWADYADTLAAQVAEAARSGAQVLLFAEYAGLSLASLCAPEERADVQRYLPAIQPWLPAYLDLHCALTRAHGVYIVAGSVPLRLPDGSYRNRAWFCRPDGTHDYQDKLIMTRFEAEVWGIEPGREAKVFDTAHGRVAINICYDVEFPLIARLQAEAGARLILAASWTESLAGHHRVKVGCRARALENQCYVALAAIAGPSPWLAGCEVGIGADGVFAPPDRFFPPDGIVAESALDAPGWLYADLDFALLDAVRADGQVLSFRDWEHQHGITATVVPEGNWFVPALVAVVAGQTLAGASDAEVERDGDRRAQSG